MTIKKYQGKTKEEAIEAAKAELGEQVVIMNIKEVKPNGFSGLFKKSTYEVTAAVEDEMVSKPVFPNPAMNLTSQISQNTLHSSNEATSSFVAVADEQLPMTQTYVSSEKEKNVMQSKVQADTLVKKQTFEPTNTKSDEIQPSDLRSIFHDVNEVIGQTNHLDTTKVYQYDEASPIIKNEQLVTSRQPMQNSQTTIQANIQPMLQEQVHFQTSSEKMHGNFGFVKMLYNVLSEHEVDEKYINQIIDDVGNIISTDNSLDYLISNVYQKMVLKLGKPKTIHLPDAKPYVVFFVGPTGVGKTTTIAKIASKFKVEQGKKVALLTADTYRIAATEQLNVYAQILETPLNIVYTSEEINEKISEMKNYDLILVDTVGFSHKNEHQRDNMKQILETVDDSYQKEVYLVLSATTKYQDLKDIIDSYQGFTDFNMIFTKLDETTMYGNILNAKLYAGANLSYVTMGQNVPDDIAEIDMQKMVKQLLGGE